VEGKGRKREGKRRGRGKRRGPTPNILA